MASKSNYPRLHCCGESKPAEQPSSVYLQHNASVRGVLRPLTPVPKRRPGSQQILAGAIVIGARRLINPPVMSVGRARGCKSRRTSIAKSAIDKLRSHINRDKL
ncbi:hypothetical protein Bca52824_062385 [Brassica carinata]|uniref:Uncharacterized protein n=1 Tax=Brassica carinata TaxID=52824 RepID=A0A8X7QCS9_BRACI|nr:hypothetical protein Bca52824_062385 [Brassica carinata]